VPVDELLAKVIESIAGVCVQARKGEGLEPDELGMRDYIYSQCYDKVQLQLAKLNKLDRSVCYKCGAVAWGLAPRGPSFSHGRRPLDTVRRNKHYHAAIICGNAAETSCRSDGRSVPIWRITRFLLSVANL
jgi:hypothetical protein